MIGFNKKCLFYPPQAWKTKFTLMVKKCACKPKNGKKRSTAVYETQEFINDSIH